MAGFSNHPEPSSDVKIDEQTLSTLLDSFNRLKKAGGMLNRDEFWVKPSGRSSQSIIETTEEGPHSGIGHLQDVKFALNTLLGSIDSVIARRKEYFPISSLPLEIFLCIMRRLLDSYEDPFEGARIAIRDLSMVNRQFRNILVETADAWTYLDLSRCNGEALERHLRRSKQAPLSVRFEYTNEMQRDISVAMAHKQRWKHLDATFRDECRCYLYDGCQRKLISNLPSMDFPSIRSLCLNVDYLFYEDLEIFSKWIFPNTETMELFDDIPSAGLLKCEAAVTSFRYIAGSASARGPGMSGNLLNKLLGCIQTLVNLRTVYLDFTEGLGTGQLEEFSEVELPNVTDFTITNWSRESKEPDFYPLKLDEFAKIMGVFKIPNVGNISIFLTFNEEELDLSHWVPLALPNAHIMGSVSRLSFNVRWYPDHKNAARPELKVNELLRPFPGLKTFSIDAGDCSIKIDLEDPPLNLQLHRLKALRIYNCENAPYDLYQMLRNVLDAGAALDELKINSKFAPQIDKLERIIQEFRQPRPVGRLGSRGFRSIPVAPTISIMYL